MPSTKKQELSTQSTFVRLTKELEAIRQITRSINATSDLRSILNGIVKTTTDVMGADSASIYLLDVSAQKLILKATTGLHVAAIDHGTLKMGEGLTGWAAQNKHVVAVRDAQSDPRFHLVPHTRERNFRSLMAVPLISQDHVIGAMNVQTKNLYTWSEGDIEFVTLISDVVAGILERAVLEEQTERKVKELSAIAEVSKAVVAPVYLDETLRLVAEMGAKAVNARRCSLLLLDESVGAFSPRAVFDRRADVQTEPAWKINELPLLNISSLDEPVLIGDAYNELDSHVSHWAVQTQLNSLLCVPLIVRDKTIGVMNVWAEGTVDFTEAQVELCTTLANQIALAIENAHLIGNTAIIQEMHHRVKNNLQNVVMLLQLQIADGAKLTAKEVLHESINRIQSIAAVHDAMAHDGFRLVDVKDVISRVVRLVQSNMSRPDQSIKIRVEGDAFRLSSRAATALSLCVNELVQNAMEHAFVGCKSGEIVVSLIDCGGSLEATVQDNGLGKRAGKLNEGSLGLNIVKTLVIEDLRGTFELKRSAKGSAAKITAPISFS